MVDGPELFEMPLGRQVANIVNRVELVGIGIVWIQRQDFGFKLAVHSLWLPDDRHIDRTFVYTIHAQQCVRLVVV